MIQAYVTSDFHLGSTHCRRDAILQFLDSLAPGAILVLNGDIVQWSDIELKDDDMRVIERLRDISYERRVIWIRGNHDEDFTFEDQGQISSHDSFALKKRLFIAHGHHFDNIMPRNSLFVSLFRRFYALRSLFPGRRMHVAQYAKRFPRLYAVLRNNVALNAIEHARENAYEAVTCGHTHYAEARDIEGVHYFNTGAWTEDPSHYLEVDEHGCKLRTWT